MNDFWKVKLSEDPKIVLRGIGNIIEQVETDHEIYQNVDAFFHEEATDEEREIFVREFYGLSFQEDLGGSFFALGSLAIGGFAKGIKKYTGVHPIGDLLEHPDISSDDIELDSTRLKKNSKTNEN